MRRLCCEEDPTTCDQLKARIEAAGIACVVKSTADDALFQASKKVAHELWIANDEDFDKAWSVLNESQPPPEEPDET